MNKNRSVGPKQRNGHLALRSRQPFISEIQNNKTPGSTSTPIKAATLSVMSQQVGNFEPKRISERLRLKKISKESEKKKEMVNGDVRRIPRAAGSLARCCQKPSDSSSTNNSSDFSDSDDAMSTIISLSDEGERIRTVKSTKAKAPLSSIRNEEDPDIDYDLELKKMEACFQNYLKTVDLSLNSKLKIEKSQMKETCESSEEEDTEIDQLSSENSESEETESSLTSFDSCSPIISNTFGGRRKAMVDIRVDENLDEYRKLQNSDCVSENVMFEVGDLDQSVLTTSYVTSHLSLIDDCPGVFANTFLDITKRVKMGYIRINPKTIKPFERYKAMNVVYTVLKGTVVFKSSRHKIVDGKAYLKKKIITRGMVITVPEGNPHAFENRTGNDVIIQYIVIQ